jgi:8-oxo-dGTP pyrophosphatase MutT (NUDIX family)
MEPIISYIPEGEQETRDKDLMLAFIERNPDCLERSNLAAHLTSSAIITDPEKEQVLLIHHNIYKSWGWVGGHNDGDPDFLGVAMREAMEETGLESVRLASEDVFMLDVIYVPNHIKRGRYVPDHLHLNVTYLLEADPGAPLSIKPDENSGVRWFPLDDLVKVSVEPRMHPVYEKAVRRIRQLKSEAIL